MRRFLSCRPVLLTGVALLMTLASGCVPVVLAGATSAGMGAASERGLGNKIDDNTMEADISSRLFQDNVDLFNAVDVTVYKGQALLNGSVPTEEARARAEELTWAAGGVSNVYNALEVGPAQKTIDYASDRWISTQIDAELTFGKGINNLNYFVKTYKGVVYLIGTAESEEELDKVLTIARGTSRVKQVVQYIQVRPS
jgi:osmotically-inducible protein OsmY